MSAPPVEEMSSDAVWPPPWAATVRAQTNAALACPRRRDDVGCFAVAEGSDARWVLRRPASSRYVRIGGIEHDAWECFEGTRTVLDISKEVGRRHAVLALPVVEAFASKLDMIGMLDGGPQDRVYSQLAIRFAGEGLAGRMRWMRQTLFYRRIAIAGFGPLISRSYRVLGRWFYTRVALVTMLAISVLGFVSYVRLGTPTPLTLPRWQLATGGLIALLTIVVHEFAHGWTVRHFGRDVHRAGLFLMYGLPGAFVDTTDMWLGTKRQRLWVSAAGPIANVVLGGALALTAVARPGTSGVWLTAAAGSYAFVVANLLPLLKLDGYYLLMDALGVADLRERGIAFSVSQLVPRWREAWRRGEWLPKLGREERLLAIYGSIALAFMVLLGASSLLVMPHRIERTVGQARTGELHGVPLAVLGTVTVLGLTVFVLNLIASRTQLRMAFARAGRALAAKRAAPLFAVHAVLAGTLAWLVPALAGRRGASAGSEWARFATLIAGYIVIRCAGRLFTVARDLSVRWLYAVVIVHGVTCSTAALFDTARSLAMATAVASIVALILTSGFWLRTLPGTIGGAWVLTIAGSLATLAGRGAGLRAGLCLVAAGMMLARLLWVHVPERASGFSDLAANERFDDMRSARHLARIVGSVGESILTRSVDVLGEASRKELAFDFNARLAGRVDVWFTADGLFSDHTTGGCSERAPLYAQALIELSDVVAARLGRSFAEDCLTAAVLDLPDRAERLFAEQVLNRPFFAAVGHAVGESVGEICSHEARRLVTRHYADFVLQAARRVFGDSIVESVVAQVNAKSSVGAALWLRGNGRLAVRDGELMAREAQDFLALVFGVLAGSVGEIWTRRAVGVADDALAWQLRERTVDECIVPDVWERGASAHARGRAPLAPLSVDRSDPRPSSLRRLATPIPSGPSRLSAYSDHTDANIGAHIDTTSTERKVDAELTPARRRVASSDLGPSALTTAPQAASAESKGAPAVLVGPVLVGFVVAVLLGAYGRIHGPTGQSDWHPFFSRMITFKSWLAAAAFACVLFQVATGTAVHRRSDPLATSSRLAAWHRLSGFTAFVLTLPVAFHCLWALGFAPSIGFNRRFVHSIVSCLLYGGYAAKVLAVSRRGRPRWALPVIGSVLFAAFAVVVASSAGWFFRAQGLQW